MGLTRLTAWIIASNEVEVLVNGPNEFGSYQGIIAHSANHEIHPHLWLVSTEFIYSSKELVIEEMNKQIKNIRDFVNTDLST